MLNVLFAGTPECAVPSLEAVARKHRIVAVLTNAPAPAGRSGTPVPTPVALAAQRLKEEGLIAADTPILTPEKITQEVRDAIAIAKPDIMACFAYGKIFGPKTLALFPRGAVNLHPSLLPRWRGCAPVPAAILAGDRETGITIQKMALEMDAGDILVQTTIPLDGTETAESLLDRAAHEGAPLLVEVLDRYEAGSVEGTPQDATQATFSAMLKKEDGEIDWTDNARAIDARIRAFSPWPGAFTKAGDNVLLILKAHVYGGSLAAGDAAPGTVVGTDKKEGILVQTGDGVLALERLQWRTKKPLDWKSFMNGSRDFTSQVLGPRQNNIRG
jgi:methionyl-tRNA formyltransferase